MRMSGGLLKLVRQILFFSFDSSFEGAIDGWMDRWWRGFCDGGVNFM